MRIMTQGVVVLAALLALSACSDTPTHHASITQYEQLSRVDWVEMTAAPTAAHVNNNGLIMMR